MPPRRPDAPGQFAFADARKVRGILEQGGWDGIDIRPIDVECAFPESELELYIARLGPLGRVLPQAEEATRRRVIESVRRAFDGYVRADEVRFAAACWMIEARGT
jgi:hypothetical protein